MSSQSPIKTVIVSGSSSNPSRTLLLARRILEQVASQVDVESYLVDIAEVGSDLGRALSRAELSERAERALQLVEGAELLIAATPVYRGSYSGHFKHLFDLLDQNALVDVPVILAATGGGDRHCLAIEHSLRPLFAFLQAFVVPVGVYASQTDFTDGVLRSELVLSRVAAAARQAARLVRPRPAASDAAPSTRPPRRDPASPRATTATCCSARNTASGR
jgi:FMN reductase